MGIQHPDDPAQGFISSPWGQEQDDYNARYSETYDAVYEALTRVQRAYADILASVATLEAIGVPHPNDWSTEEVVAVLTMNAHAIAMDTGMDAAERGMDHGGRVDIAVAAAARELAQIIGARK